MAFQPVKSLSGKHVQGPDQFTREEIDGLMRLANEMKTATETGKQSQLAQLHQGKIMAPLFFENSSRTFSSFCAAMQKLGGSVVYLPLESSSVAKGETLSDTVRTMDAYADVTVLRHPDEKALAEAVRVATHPIMNAGNGTGEHPSQALLDVYTMNSELGLCGGSSSNSGSEFRIALVGDLKHGRTVHSLAKLLARLYKPTAIHLVSPPQLRMPETVVAATQKECGVPNVHTHDALSPGIVASVDVIYVTRVQKERFATEQEYSHVKGSYAVTKATMKDAKEKMIVMHPLPRNEELATEVDDDPRAAYFQQMRYGLFMRMALLHSVLS